MTASAGWNRGASITSTQDLLEYRAQQCPLRTAVLVDHQARPDLLTYGAWWEKSRQIAELLRECGVGPGRRIAVVADSFAWAAHSIFVLGVLESQASAICLPAGMAKAEIERLLAFTSATGFIDVRGLSSSEISPSVLSELLEIRLDNRSSAEMSGMDEALVLLTSGTSGQRKVLSFSHSALLSDPRIAHAFEHSFDPSTTRLHAAPPHTNLANTILVSSVLGSCQKSVVAPVPDARSWCRLVSRHRVTEVSLVPTIARAICEDVAAGEFDLTSVRKVHTTAGLADSSLLARLAEMFQCAEIVNVYGTTETGWTCLGQRFDRSTDTVSPWLPLSSRTELKMLPVTDDKPQGLVRLALRSGATSLIRFLRKDGSGAPVADGDGWVRTSDVVALGNEGCPTVIFRADDAVDSGGYLVAPAVVESALFRHPSVIDVAVMGVEHRRLGQTVVAAVVMRPRNGSQEALISHLRNELSEWEIPKQWLFVKSIPRDEMGKPRRREIRGWFSESAEGSRLLDDSTSMQLADAWHEVLGVWPNEQSNFYQHGGESFAAMRLVATIAERLGVKLEITAPLEFPIFRQLGEQIMMSLSKRD